MNPQNSEASGMQLPPPVMEQAPIHPNGHPAENQPAAAEQGQAAGAEQSAASQFVGAQMPASIPLPAAPVIPVTSPSNDASNTTQSTSSLVADDGDLIEKEWVMKAKAIVERNTDDPYKQTEELTAFKADYMKQRYNKTIKISK